MQKVGLSKLEFWKNAISGCIFFWLAAWYVIFVIFLLFFHRYETSSEVLEDIDCTKRAVCEVYQNSIELGELGKRAVHGFDMIESYMDYLKLLPSEFVVTLDEILVRRFFYSILQNKCT